MSEEVRPKIKDRIKEPELGIWKCTLREFLDSVFQFLPVPKADADSVVLALKCLD